MVSYGTADGIGPAGATSPLDYMSTTGTLVFDAGVTERTFLVQTVADELDEDEETFTVSLSGASNATLGLSSSLTVTIADDPADVPPMVTLGGSPSGSEGTTLTFTATLEAESGRDVMVRYGVTADTATANDDYMVVGDGMLAIAAGQTEASFDVDLLDDALDEDDETLTVLLSGATNAIPGAMDRLRVTIVDTDAEPTVGLRARAGTDLVSDEGTELTFEAVLSEPSGRRVTVLYGATADTATADDYTVSWRHFRDRRDRRRE